MKAVVVDDDNAMHLIMKRLLLKTKAVSIAGMFKETKTAFAFMMENQVDLLFVDINMVPETGLQFAEKLRASGSEVKIIFVTSHKEYALPSYEVFAYDYIVKPVSEERLARTIQRAATEMKKKPLKERREKQENSAPLPGSLTKREAAILQLLGTGMTNKEIAVEFKVTEGTIKNHMVNIFSKLHVKNRVQAAALASSLALSHENQ